MRPVFIKLLLNGYETIASKYTFLFDCKLHTQFYKNVFTIVYMLFNFYIHFAALTFNKKEV